jgi:hypothetical protein
MQMVFKLHAQLARKDNTSLSSVAASRSIMSLTFTKTNGIGSGSSSGIDFLMKLLGTSSDIKSFGLRLSPALLFGIERMFPDFATS